MHILDGNACKVPKCVLFMGGDHGVKDAEKVEKTLKMCAPKAKREFGKETEIKTKGGIELLACISAVQGCGHLIVEGNTVKVCHDGKCAIPGQGYINRFEKKFKDGLKEDYQKLMPVIQMSFGIL